jgi:uncharacterized membrane protein YGL010W
MNTTRLDGFFKDYASFHRTPGNQSLHMVGIPLIVLSILGLLGHLPVSGGMTGSDAFRVDGGTVLWLGAMIWYVLLDWKLAAPFSLVSLGLYFVGRALPVPVLWGVFLGGWAIQYAGHYIYEHKSPAFYKNAEHLLIGPFWIFSKMVGYRH